MRLQPRPIHTDVYGESIGQFGCESDRVSQTVNGITTNYVLDSASLLTQVLQDEANTYVYGVDRIAQMNGAVPEYYLTDGLGSVRQLVDSNGAVILTKSYDPYGTETGFVGSSATSYGFTGEMTDPTGLLYLRARYYESYLNQFIQPDTIVPDPYQPMDWNKYTYVRNNPINFTDPRGFCAGKESDPNNPDIDCWKEIETIEATYSNIDIDPDNWETAELESVKKALDGMTYTFGGVDNFSTVYNKTITLYRANWFISWITGSKEAATAVGPGTITVYDDTYTTSYDLGTVVIIHEFGHLLDARYGYVSMSSFKDKFWGDCKPNFWGDDCSRFLHDPQCEGIPASSYGYVSPKEDFAELFAWHVWSNNGWDVSVLYSEFMPPDQDRLEYIEDLISTIKSDL